MKAILWSGFLIIINISRANPWFDEKDYAAMNPDVVRQVCPTGNYDPKILREHYLSRGVKEGRFGRPYADPVQLRRILESENISPAASIKRDALDVSRDFKVNDVAVTVVVRGPSALSSKAKEVFRAKEASETVEHYFQEICETIRRANLGQITIPKQNLVAENSSDKSYQAIIRDIKDVAIDFSGSTLIFTDPTKRGLLISGDLQRVRFHNLAIDWNQGFVSPASVVLEKDDSIHLKIQGAATGNLPITQFFGFYDLATKQWNAKQRNQWVNFSVPIKQDATGEYTAKELEALRPLLKVGQPFPGIVRHHAPGKLAIVVTGNKVEDVQMTNLNILNSAYMGIGVDRIKRGFLLANSTISPKVGSYVSTASDGLHITSASDVIVEGNTFVGMGDDGTNIQGYTYKLGNEISPGTFILDSGVFHPQVNDRVAVYSPMMDFLGDATISDFKPQENTPNSFTVTLKDTSKLASPLKSGDRIGIIAQHPVRIVIKGNKYGPNRSRGILIQGSLALVDGNVITGSTQSGILVASDADNWSEGMGATSIILQNNTIKSANYFDMHRGSRSLGAISLMSEIASPGAVAEYTGVPGRTIGTYPLFQNILIAGNTISDSMGAGIFVASARNVQISRNRINSPILVPAKGQMAFGHDQGITRLSPITVFRSVGVKSDDMNMLLIFPGPESKLAP